MELKLIVKFDQVIPSPLADMLSVLVPSSHLAQKSSVRLVAAGCAARSSITIASRCEAAVEFGPWKRRCVAPPWGLLAELSEIVPCVAEKVQAASAAALPPSK